MRTCLCNADRKALVRDTLIHVHYSTEILYHHYELLRKITHHLSQLLGRQNSFYYFVNFFILICKLFIINRERKSVYFSSSFSLCFVSTLIVIFLLISLLFILYFYHSRMFVDNILISICIIIFQ